jgi:uncharacterized integral membrane protein
VNTVSLIIGLLLGIVLVAFGAQNAQPVSLHFFAWDTQPVPLVLALAVAMLVGIILTLIASIPGRIRSRRQRQELHRQIEAQGRMPAPIAEPPAVERNEGIT